MIDNGIAALVCDRGLVNQDMVKLQLEVPRTVLDAYKEKVKGTVTTPKKLMEEVLCSWVQGPGLLK